MNSVGIAGSLHRLFICGVLIVASSTGWCGVDEELIQLERKRNDALVEGDWAIYDALLADEFFHAHVLGGVLEKEPHLEHLRAGRSKVKKVVLEDLTVRPYGDVAVVTAVSHVDIEHMDLAEVSRLTGVPVEELEKKGRKVTRHSRYLHVWVKKKGEWKLVARQATYLPAEE